MYDSYSSKFVDKILKYDHSNPNVVEPSRFVSYCRFSCVTSLTKFESLRQNRNASGIGK